MYDYLVVGSGLYGAVMAHLLKKKGKSCLVLEKRNHLGGNIYTECIEDIHVHQYGAHIFHTNNERVWKFMNGFATFNNFINCPLANYKGEMYNLPFNMNTFYRIWGEHDPEIVQRIIDHQRSEVKGEPKNLEEQAIKLVGRDVFETLINGYTEKQWGRPCSDLPAFIIKRLPVRMSYDNNYFDDPFQGIPIGGYTAIIEKMLENIPVILGEDYLKKRDYWDDIADHVIYSGPIDAYFNYCFGHLEYRSLRFETTVLDKPNYQGNAVINYTDKEIAYTRVIEHKFFEFKNQPKTVISREYSIDWSPNIEPFYPINDVLNTELYNKYKRLAMGIQKVSIGGRLGEYKYYNMDEVIQAAMDRVESICD